MELAFFDEAEKVWKEIMRNPADAKSETTIPFQKKLLDLFHVGEYYYYFFDFQTLQFRYLSPDAERILGFPADSIDAQFLMSLIHPDDQSAFLNNETAAVAFLKGLPNNKLSKYKVSYDYRIRKSDGQYIRVLQQAVALQYDDENNLLLTLGVHTDISHLKTSTESVLSFLGLEGEPSYTNVDARKIYKPTSELFTKREKEIVGYLLQGEQSATIANKLSLSKYTIDTHRKNILFKTKTKNTVELAIKVINEGLI